MHGQEWMRILYAIARAWGSPRDGDRPNGALVHARGQRGLTIAEAAEQIGISKGTLTRAERGTPIRATKLAQIAAFYGIPVDELGPGDSS
jgi:DNA-binding XRE family transcriptional regulator